MSVKYKYKEKMTDSQILKIKKVRKSVRKMSVEKCAAGEGQSGSTFVGDNVAGCKA